MSEIEADILVGAHVKEGTGAYCAKLKHGADETELFAKFSGTTAPRMELQGVLDALKLCPDDSRVTVRTQQKWMAEGIYRKRFFNWPDRPNGDLWLQLRQEANRLSLTATWSKQAARCSKDAKESFRFLATRSH